MKAFGYVMERLPDGSFYGDISIKKDDGTWYSTDYLINNGEYKFRNETTEEIKQFIKDYVNEKIEKKHYEDYYEIKHQ